MTTHWGPLIFGIIFLIVGVLITPGILLKHLGSKEGVTWFGAVVCYIATFVLLLAAFEPSRGYKHHSFIADDKDRY